MSRLPLPTFFDADDLRMLGTIVVLSLLVFWAAVVVAVALGVAVRVFELAKGGG